MEMPLLKRMQHRVDRWMEVGILVPPLMTTPPTPPLSPLLHCVVATPPTPPLRCLVTTPPTPPPTTHPTPPSSPLHLVVATPIIPPYCPLHLVVAMPITPPSSSRHPHSCIAVSMPPSSDTARPLSPCPSPPSGRVLLAPRTPSNALSALREGKPLQAPPLSPLVLIVSHVTSYRVNRATGCWPLPLGVVSLVVRCSGTGPLRALT